MNDQEIVAELERMRLIIADLKVMLVGVYEAMMKRVHPLHHVKPDKDEVEQAFDECEKSDDEAA